MHTKLKSLIAYFLLTPAGLWGAPITADFSAGNSFTDPDGFTGAAGGGWLDGWHGSDLPGQLLGVLSEHPLTKSGGNYLSVVVPSLLVNQWFGVYRHFDGSAAGVDMTQKHVFTFDFRPESTLAHGQFYYISNGTIAGLLPNDTTAWAIRGDSTTGWQFGHLDAFSGSGMPIIVGKTYHFTITVDPAKGTWIGSVADGTNTVTASDQSLLTSGSSDGSFLEFSSIVDQGGTSGAVNFSIGSIKIAQAP